jgi:MFS family permease
MAMPLLVYRLTNSSYLLGVVGFATQLPSFIVTPFAGVIADRVNRRRLLFVTQGAAMIQAFGLAALVAFGNVQVWQVVLFNMSLNAINAFDMTARQSFLGDMLDDRQDLAYAISLNSSMVQLARLFGPFLAAWLIQIYGEAACFFINGLSFVAVLAALGAMHIRPVPRVSPHEPMFLALLSGAVYVRRSPAIRWLLILVGIVSIVGMPYSVLMPVFNDQVLHGDAVTYGHLYLAIGCGALVASIYLATRGVRGALTRIEIAPFGIGIFLIGFSLTQTQLSAVLMLLGVGFFVMLLINSSNTLIQSIVADDMRGRVMSFYALAFLGTAPLGSLLAGSSAQAFGLSAALQLAGGACIIGGLVYFWRAQYWKATVKAQLRAQRVRPPVEPTIPPTLGYVGESLTPTPGAST